MVNADNRHKANVRKTAECVRDRIKEAGADRIELMETQGHPIVFGERIIDPKKPTVLVYGYHITQPPGMGSKDGGDYCPVWTLRKSASASFL